MKKRCLLTGVGGFLGSHILEEILVSTDWDVVGIASWQHKGVPERISDSIHYQEHKDRVTIITHDLTAPISLFTASRIGPIDYVIHAAAESHVDRSIEDPVPFVHNNVNVTLTMLEWARVAKPEAFIQVSTDEVYGSAPEGYSHKEWDTILPSNPYSASKAAQEALAIAYWRTYDVPVIITNTMNLIGERQDTEKFIPKTVKAIMEGKIMTIHVSPEGKPGSRHYIHCRNQANALVWILKTQQVAMYGVRKVEIEHYTTSDGFDETSKASYMPDRPDRYHISGQEEIDNLDMAQRIATILGKELKYELVDYHSIRHGHDTRYSLDSSKIYSLGWTPPIPFEESLERTISWSIEHQEWLT